MFKTISFIDKTFIVLSFSDYFKLSTSQKYHIFYKICIEKYASYSGLAKVTLQKEHDVDLAILVLITGILNSRRYDWGKGPISRSVLENIHRGLMTTVFNDRYVVDWQLHDDSTEKDEAIRYITSFTPTLSVA